jgi:hypothetical protein
LYLRTGTVQKRSGQFATTPATGRYTQLGLQIIHSNRTGGNGFFDFTVGNRIADTNKHDVLQKYYASRMRLSFILEA